jgi:cysteine synthase B
VLSLAPHTPTKASGRLTGQSNSEISPGINGVKPLEQPGDIVSAILDESLINERLPVALKDAVARCRELARQRLFVWPSSSAFVHRAGH